jgi:cytochrome c oxidase subunit 2
MTSLTILLVLVLLLVVFGLLFRLQILTAIFSGSYVRQIGTSNRVNAVLMLVFMVVGGAAFFWSFAENFGKMNPPHVLDNDDSHRHCLCHNASATVCLFV